MERALEQMFQEDGFRLYMHELTVKILEQVLSSADAVEGYYREMRCLDEHVGGYREIDWFLTDKALVRFEITPGSVNAITYLRDEIVCIERLWRIIDDFGHRADIKSIVISLKGLDEKLTLMVPSLDANGDVEGFVRLASLLG